MLALLHSILAIGVNPDTPFEESVRIKAMNRGALIGIGILSIVILLGFDSKPFVWHMAAMILILIISIALNALHLPRSGHYFSAVFIPLWLMETSMVFGDKIGVEYYFLVVLVSLLTVLELNNRARVYTAVLITCAVIFVKLYQKYHAPVFPPPKFEDFFFVCSLTCSFAIVCVMCLNLLNDFKQNKTALLDSKNDLQVSNQFKDKLFSIIGHDLKSPLNSLAASLQLLNDDSLPSEDKKFLLHELEQQVTKTTNILSELVDWSSKNYFQSKRTIATNKTEVDINRIVESLFVFFHATAIQKKIRLENKISPGFLIDADADQIQFVLRNLIGNALKFNKIDGNGYVSVRSEKNNHTLRIEVTDNGIGMPDNVRARLFNIDTRVTTEGTMNERGTGLGLIFCKEFIENNGGTLEVKSTEGIGSTFVIEFNI